ncbi:MAG: DUF1156 domain-containing protein, partial [Hyphomicrobium sp.]|nr:DUF1156 domain-containing protein [Hyphomicrobium sp.]
RRPLAACRAVLFAQLVDDPSAHPDKFPTPEAQEAERKRLFGIIEELVKWENSTNEEVLEKARAEIRRSCDGELPPVYDPFSGGGSIPLEAQRLGLPAYGSDLNPVAVMIGKAMIEIPPKFKDMPPIHPGPKERQFYRNAEGLAEDVKYYGEWMREKAWERIGHLYPQVDLPKEYGGGKATVIAWIWARTVPSPDPAFSDVQVPIAANFMLHTKKNSEIWIEPILNKELKSIEYQIRRGGTKEELAIAAEGTKAGRGANFRCLFSGAAITPEYVKASGKKGLMSQTLIAVVAKGRGSRIFLRPLPEQVAILRGLQAEWYPEIQLPNHSQYIGVLGYGFETFGDLYTPRQAHALTTFCDLVREAHQKLLSDITKSKPPGAESKCVDGDDYAQAVAVYLGIAASKLSVFLNTQSRWRAGESKTAPAFGRQAIAMVWDFAEVNPFAGAGGDFYGVVEGGANAVSSLKPTGAGSIIQQDAQTQEVSIGKVISTDPPYYDNIPYADLSDFFYSWLRRALAGFYPELFSTLSVPKLEELVADRVRHGTAEKAEEFFMRGMSSAMSRMHEGNPGDYPVTIYYAFKQNEIEQEGISSTGWATFLDAVVSSGFSVVGTWPMRTEMATRMRAAGSNALANSVVLVCRKKDATADTVTRAEFIRSLKHELPPAIAELQAANIAPADMPQSAIGPGMGVFSGYKAVLEADDKPMSVKTALQLINAQLDEYLGGIQGEFDADTRFAITWFEQFGMGKGDYGVADNLARARGISVESVKHAGVVESAAGKVRILARSELEDDWSPESDGHLTVWECLQYLVRRHEKDGVSEDTAALMKKIGRHAEAVKDLAYCLYDISANKRKDAKEATAYNALIADWAELTRQAAALPATTGGKQIEMGV